ncbi:hypothetical protein JCM19046_3059 [Bacillus sp. JCM 19046]|nr:hypothetical protein JCM19046_3059 [Bacillus sp. JCM 19046]
MKHKDRFARLGFDFQSDVFVVEGGWFDKDASLTISIGVVDNGEISSLKSINLWVVEKRWFTLRGILDFESEEELLADLEENIEMLYQSYVKAD